MRFMSVLRRAAARASAASIVAAGLSAPLPVGAHHSEAAFDTGRVIQLNGTVKEFQWTNPHVWIQLYVKNDDGKTVEWSIEGGGPNSLARKGWRPATFKPGAAVTIKAHPMRNGAPAAAFIGARFADGSTLGRWNTVAD